MACSKLRAPKPPPAAAALTPGLEPSCASFFPQRAERRHFVFLLVSFQEAFSQFVFSFQFSYQGTTPCGCSDRSAKHGEQRGPKAHRSGALLHPAWIKSTHDHSRFFSPPENVRHTEVKREPGQQKSPKLLREVRSRFQQPWLPASVSAPAPQLQIYPPEALVLLAQPSRPAHRLQPHRSHLPRTWAKGKLFAKGNPQSLPLRGKPPLPQPPQPHPSGRVSEERAVPSPQCGGCSARPPAVSFPASRPCRWGLLEKLPSSSTGRHQQTARRGGTMNFLFVAVLALPFLLGKRVVLSLFPALQLGCSSSSERAHSRDAARCPAAVGQKGLGGFARWLRCWERNRAGKSSVHTS